MLDPSGHEGSAGFGWNRTVLPPAQFNCCHWLRAVSSDFEPAGITFWNHNHSGQLARQIPVSTAELDHYSAESVMQGGGRRCRMRPHCIRSVAHCRSAGHASRVPAGESIRIDGHGNLGDRPPPCPLGCNPATAVWSSEATDSRAAWRSEATAARMRTSRPCCGRGVTCRENEPRRARWRPGRRRHERLFC